MEKPNSQIVIIWRLESQHKKKNQESGHQHSKVNEFYAWHHQIWEETIWLNDIFLKEKAYTCERGRQTFGVENSTIYKFKNV